MEKVRQLSRNLPSAAQGRAASEALGSPAHAVGASRTLTLTVWDGAGSSGAGLF